MTGLRRPHNMAKPRQVGPASWPVGNVEQAFQPATPTFLSAPGRVRENSGAMKFRISMPLSLPDAPFPSSLAISVHNNFQLSLADSKPLPALARHFPPAAMLPLN